jgi:hypothetical protein
MDDLVRANTEYCVDHLSWQRLPGLENYFRVARHPAGIDWNTAERLRGIRLYKERWPVITGRVMLSATKELRVGLWLLAGSRVLAALVALVTPCE